MQGGIVGMDVGDVDGDGQDEIVAVQAKKLIVYKKEKDGLRAVGTFEGTSCRLIFMGERSGGPAVKINPISI